MSAHARTRARACGIVVGNIHGDRARIGALANPCMDYFDYMQAMHPGHFTPEDVRDYQITYAKQPSAEVGLECLAMLSAAKRADRQVAKAAAAPSGRRAKV